jgi:hypothetical protein
VDSTDWAVQRIHEFVMGWSCNCCTDRNLGLHAIGLTLRSDQPLHWGFGACHEWAEGIPLPSIHRLVRSLGLIGLAQHCRCRCSLPVPMPCRCPRQARVVADAGMGVGRNFLGPHVASPKIQIVWPDPKSVFEDVFVTRVGCGLRKALAGCSVTPPSRLSSIVAALLTCGLRRALMMEELLRSASATDRSR